MGETTSNALRVGKNAYTKSAEFMALHSQQGRGEIFKAPPTLVLPPRDLLDRLSGQNAKEKPTDKEENKGWMWKAKSQRPKLHLVNGKPKLVEAEEEHITDIVTRAGVTDKHLREILAHQIEGLGTEDQVMVCDGDDVYFFLATDPNFARMIKNNASAFSTIPAGKRFGTFIESVMVNGTVYVVTKREKVKATTECKIIKLEEKRKERERYDKAKTA